MIKSNTNNLGIIEAIKELKEISLIDRLRYEHEMRLRAKWDRENEDEFVYEQGREEGKKEGLKEGREEGIKSFINTLRKVKFTDEQIVNQLMEEYGLSREEALEKLK